MRSADRVGKRWSEAFRQRYYARALGTPRAAPGYDEAARRVQQRARGLVVHRPPAAAGAEAPAVRGDPAPDAPFLDEHGQKRSSLAVGAARVRCNNKKTLHHPSSRASAVPAPAAPRAAPRPLARARRRPPPPPPRRSARASAAAGRRRPKALEQAALDGGLQRHGRPLAARSCGTASPRAARGPPPRIGPAAS